MPDADRSTGRHLSPRDGALPETDLIPPGRTPAQLFDELFELSAVGMGHVGRDGSWLRVSRRLCDITGYTPEELLGRTWLDLVSPDDLDQGRAGTESLDDQAVTTTGIERPCLRKDGSLVWVRIMATRVNTLDGAPAYYVAVVEDISQRKQLEVERDRLLEHERGARAAAEARANELQAIFDAMADGIIVYDRDGHMLRTNTANRDILGNPDEWPAHFSLPIEERLARLDMRDESGQPVPREQWPHMRVLRGEVLSGPTAAQVSARSLDGRIKQLSISGAPLRTASGEIVGAVCIHHDVTERRQLRTEARERAALLTSVLETMPDGVAIFGPDGSVLRVNAAFRALFGLDVRAEFFSLPAEDRRHLLEIRDLDGSPLAPERSPYQRVLGGETLTGADSADLITLTPDGRQVYVNVVGSAIRDAQGRTAAAVLVYRDVTERRHLDRHAREVAAEAAARASQLEAVLDAIQDGVFVYDRDNQLVLANPAAQRVNPFTVQPDYLALPYEERIVQFALRDANGRPLAPDELPAARVLRGEVLTGDATIDTMMRQPGGHEILINTSGAPVRGPDGSVQGAVVVTRDVTERGRLERRTQDALQALLAMAQALVGAPGEAPAPDGEQARASAGDLLAQQLVELTHGMLGCDRVAITSIEPETGTLCPVAVVGLSREVERWWRAEMPRHRISDFLPPDLLDRLRAGEVVLNAEEQRLRPGGRPLPARSVLIAPLRVADRLIGTLTYDHSSNSHTYTAGEMALAGAVAQLAALALQRERLLQERGEARGRAIALQQANQRMDEFLSIAAHELRTPVTVIKMNLQILARAMARDVPAAPAPGRRRGDPELLRRTEKQVGRLTRLVDDLLDATRIRAGKLELRREPADLSAIVREAVEEQRAAHPDRRITLDVLCDEPAPVFADPDRIGEVVTNFLTNALKYSQPEERVAVRLTCGPAEARVAVRDRGPGIPAAELEHVWELFHRVPGIEVQSGSGVGLGLGLHLCQTIVERHGGRVGVESVVGRGSTFWFTLLLHGSTDTRHQ